MSLALFATAYATHRSTGRSPHPPRLLSPSVDTGNRLPGGKRQQDDLGTKPMEWRLSVQQLLPVLPVGSDVDIDEQPSTQTRDSDRRYKMVDCRGSENRQSNR